MRQTLLGISLALAGCATTTASDEPLDGANDPFVVAGGADAFGVPEGSPAACAVLRLVNTASGDTLRDAARSGVVALQILQARAGEDGPEGTGDDRVIASLEALDAIPYVGPRTFERLVAYSVDPRYSTECGLAPGPTPEPDAGPVVEPPGVMNLTALELCSLLKLVNEYTQEQLDWDVDLDSRLAEALIDARPITSFAELDSVPRFGESALTNIFNHLHFHPELRCGALPAAACAGGTFDGVDFTPEEECRTVDFMNTARWSQLAGLTATLRRTVYFEVPGGVAHPSPGYRAARWRSVGDLVPLASATSLRTLRSEALAWTPGGGRFDTIADVWANRAALEGKPVLFEHVFVARSVSRPSEVWSEGQYFCHELRDDSTRPNWLHGCVLWVNADSSPRCGNTACLDGWIGRFVQVRGTVRRVDGSYRINLSTDEPVESNPTL